MLKTERVAIRELTIKSEFGVPTIKVKYDYIITTLLPENTESVKPTKDEVIEHGELSIRAITLIDNCLFTEDWFKEISDKLVLSVKEFLENNRYRDRNREENEENN